MKNERLLSLDVLRGLTIAAMIMVNDMGSGEHIYTPLEHVAWAGLHPTDLIFPFFMFIMGVSMAFSLGNHPLAGEAAFWKKLLRRTILLFAFGVFLSWFGLLCSGSSLSESLWHVRIPGVLQRLALSYFLATLLVVVLPSRRKLTVISIGLLVLYWLLLAFGNGFTLSQENIIGVVDRWVFGAAHIYQKSHLVDGTPIAFDPEGLLSTLPCIPHVLFGYFCGRTIRSPRPLDERLTQLSVTGISLLGAGWLLSYGCPVIKRVWTPSYVLISSGCAYLLLVWLTWLIDIRQRQNWCGVFRSYGMNPLVLYILAEFFSIILNATNAKYATFTFFDQCLGNAELASLLYGVLYSGVFGLLACWLHKRRIFIKL